MVRCWGLHGLWGKTVFYEPLMGVPLLMSGPGIRPGHHDVGYPISLMDLYPTTCALAGLRIPKGLDGVNFSDVLADPGGISPPREFAPFAYYARGAGQGRGRCGRTRPSQRLASHTRRKLEYVEVEGGGPILFDMANDPEEAVNLAGRPEQAPRCRDMRERLFRGFSWEGVHDQLSADGEHIRSFYSGQRPSVSIPRSEKTRIVGKCQHSEVMSVF